ncbi:DUF2478 domain-containing protein [Paracoccus tegillarcae]|uniref:DUF2478 domain-containing protein n=1 Tax=Paracoccus tegillarcae TaxID=1529068 RepID=A0A2K9EWJ2_9RHOB|nr:DUF2478 domain-containing protein [Paracoccus tegillarcae]AUH35306.1 hypothetical protein CUV01_08300 [Paracoccus tegillarcae]
MLGCFVLNGAEPGKADRLLEALAGQLAAEGLRIAGAVQVNSAPSADCACDMDLRILGDTGPMVRISQSLGPGSVGCRLDAGGLQMAAGRVSAALQQGADLCILPKFGKQEAMGLGFRDCIGQALDQEIPVLTHVPAGQYAAFEAFAGEFAQWVEPQALATWCRSVTRGTAA